MIEQIEAALAEIAKKYGDARVHHCRVSVDAAQGDRCLLSGTVLDEETKTAVISHLTTHFPTTRFDAGAVKLLRQSPPTYLTVCTNVAGLHKKPSRVSELTNQVLNGWQVEPLLTQDSWVYARLPDGYLGWLHRPYLDDVPSLAMTHLVGEPVSFLRHEPDLGAALASRVAGGTAVSVTAVNGTWAELTLAGGMSGWIPQADLRPLDALPQDENKRRQQMVQDAAQYIGVPYLWGGNTGLGIDCSGLTQLLHKMIGIDILRDADMQFDTGKSVEPPFQPGDLLFFGSTTGYRSISHVGMSLGGWRIIHSSGPRNGVYEDDVQAASWLQNAFLGGQTFVGNGGQTTDH